VEVGQSWILVGDGRGMTTVFYDSAVGASGWRQVERGDDARRD
jgi:hypothetical protein